jgi:hypothetical protein
MRITLNGRRMAFAAALVPTVAGTVSSASLGPLMKINAPDPVETETGILGFGFNIWRFRSGKGVKVSRTLIRAKRTGEPTGASYLLVDRGARGKSGLTYRLQLIDPNGRGTWYAAFVVAAV